MPKLKKSIPAISDFFQSVPRFVYVLGVTLSLIPVLVMCLVAGDLPDTRVFNWEIQYDQFDYAAQAREIFENGNGFAHANAFDIKEGGPAVYSFLFPLIVGYFWKLTNWPIMLTYLPLRLVFGTLLAVVLWHLTQHLFKDRKIVKGAFFCVMIGGGLAGWLASLSALFGQVSLQNLVLYVIQMEGIAAWWFLNIFRNYFYAPELLYHLLFYLSLLFLLKKSWWSSLLFFALTLYAHPFTGVQLGLIYMIYNFLNVCCEKKERRHYLRQGLLAAGLFTVFFVYHFIWLRSLAVHQGLMEKWVSEAFVVDFGRYLLCYGIWLFFGLFSLFKNIKVFFLSRRWRLLVVMFGVTLFLMNHHFFLPFRFQPAHFARGYLFLPLVFFTCYLFEQKNAVANDLRKLIKGPVLVCGFFLFVGMDNIFFMHQAYRQANQIPQTITVEENNVLTFLKDLPAGKPYYVASTNEAIGYLLCVKTSHRSLLGHNYIVPDFWKKKVQMQKLTALGDTAVLDEYKEINLLILTNDEVKQISKRRFFKSWRKLHQNAHYQIYLKSDE